MIERCQQKIFALALNLTNDANQAYDITVASFVEALQSGNYSKKEEAFLGVVAGIAVNKCRDGIIAAALDDSLFPDLPQPKKSLLEFSSQALHLLSFEDQAVLLLRDQLHLSYKNISSVLRQAEISIKIQLTQARGKLREKINQLISDAQ